MSMGRFARISGFCIAAAAGIIAASAQAQMANQPPEVAAKIAEMGPKFNPDVLKATADLYKPLVKAPPYDGVTIVKDVAYGADDRNKVDVYQPAKGKGAAVLIFIPGGGFVGGSKDGYANLGGYFATHGIVTVVANYRLAPANPWPAGAEDTGKVVAWVKANAAQYGGNGKRVFLFGQSAGATHVADYTFNETLHPKAGTGLAGTILVSGYYQPTAQDQAANVVAYYGSDAAKYADRTSINHVAKSGKAPLFLAYAQYDPEFLSAPTLALAHEVCVRDQQCPSVLWLKGHNHVSTVFSIGSKDTELSRDLVNFIRTAR
jgi:acetyl esterase/lipase